MCTLAQLKERYGATHIHEGTGMVYKQCTEPLNDGTTRTYWAYLSYCNIWMGSGIKQHELHKLTPIKEGTTND